MGHCYCGQGGKIILNYLYDLIVEELQLSKWNFLTFLHSYN